MADQFRQEHKFIISDFSKELLRYRLKAALRQDKYARPDGSYFIRSLYFDDSDLSAYREKLDGVKHRSKIRLRFYNFNEGYIVLEKKERNGDLCRKTAQEVSKEMAQRLIAGGPTGGGCELFDEFDALRSSRGLHPMVIVDYLRYPFTYPVSNVRVTLDTAVSTPIYSLDFFNRALACYPVLDEGESVLEVKFDSFAPEPVTALFEDIPKVKMAVSKYVKCLSMINE